MNKASGKTLAGVLFALLGAGPAHASIFTVYTEDFEQPFPVWESNWFGMMSDASNVYCGALPNCATRGNNPDGLWLTGQAGAGIDVVFDSTFGASLASFQLGVAGYAPTMLSAYDKDGKRIFNQDVFLTNGAYTNPGTYANYTITSSNGISRIAFSGTSAGNTSIDNLVAITSQIPEPATLGLFGLGLLGAAVARRGFRPACRSGGGA